MENMENRKFCKYCGAELNVEASFCRNCGQRCDAENSAEPASEQQEQETVVAAPELPEQVDMKDTARNNLLPLICMGVGLLLFIYGLCIRVPSDYLGWYVEEYVGGDAYNYIIEAALRGGRIAGAQIGKYVCASVGCLIMCLSALKMKIVKNEREGDKESL